MEYILLKKGEILLKFDTPIAKAVGFFSAKRTHLFLVCTCLKLRVCQYPILVHNMMLANFSNLMISILC